VELYEQTRLAEGSSVSPNSPFVKVLYPHAVKGHDILSSMLTRVNLALVKTVKSCEETPINSSRVVLSLDAA